MSGICGVVSRGAVQTSVDAIAAMCASIKHRGPAASRAFADDAYAAIGQVHLDTLTPPRSPVYPAFLAAEDVVVSLDGFVLNRNEVLRSAGVDDDLDQNRDARAVVEAYRAHGPKLMSHLEGPFTLALWDRRRNELFLARDRMGEKSVYYYAAPDQQTLIFGSEIKAILTHSTVRAELDMEGLALHLAFGYIPGHSTLFRHIYKLLPGEWLRFAPPGPIVREKFWRYPRLGEGISDEAYCVQQVRERALTGIERYVNGAEAVGVFLSGGMDSSTVVAGLREVGVPRIKTFTIGFDVQSNNPRQAEDLGYARLVAKHFGTEHHELVVRRDAHFSRRLPEVLRHFDDLIMTPHIYTKCSLAYMARDGGVNLVFTGNGSIGEAFRSPKERMKLEAKIEGATSDAERYYRIRNRLFSLNDQRLLLSKGPPIDEQRIIDVLEETMQDVDCDDFIRKFLFTNTQVTRTEKTIKGYERAGSLASVEVLAPFLDGGVVDLSTQLPLSFDGQNPTGLKIQLKKAFADLLPHEVLERKVIGYPSYYWTNGELQEFQKQLLSRKAIEENGIFSYEAVRRVLDADRVSPKKSAGKRSWALTQFALWYEIHIKRNPVFLTPSNED